MTWKIPLFKMYWDENDIQAVSSVIRSGMNWASGPDVLAFEEEIAHYIGTKYALTFSSGTSALHAVLMAHDIGRADEVIVPSFTFIATANSPQFVGAKPVFADIEEETYGLDPADVNEKITKKTRAIMPVHYGGCPCRIKELREIADDNNLILIEDAAEAFGARIQDRMVGTFGESAMMSFCQNKIITTGEGGAIVTDSQDVYERMKLIRSHGRLETADYFSTSETMDYVTLGFNSRISTMTAALGRSQLRKVDHIINLRISDAAYYIKNLQKTGPEISTPSLLDDYYSVYQLFSIRARRRDELMKHLSDLGVMTKVYFSPVHETHFYKNVLGYECSLPVTEKISREIISLPFYPGITRDDMGNVVKMIRLFYGEG